ncbi:MAG: PAS domain S-box protein [Rhodospirillales bacterium]|nr:PAS domain S-box protein [Rhodospirillales bacterium]
MEPPNNEKLSWKDIKSSDVGRPYVFSMFLSVAILGIIVSALGWSLWQSRRAALDVAEITLQYQARALGDKINSNLNELIHDLNDTLTSAHVEDFFKGKNSSVFFDDINRRFRGEDLHHHLYFFNADGRAIARDDSPKLDVRSVETEPFFLKHKEQYVDFIFKPLPASRPDETPLISLSRSVVGATGEFLGVVRLLADLSTIQAIVADDEFGGFENAVLFDADGVVITAWPPVKLTEQPASPPALDRILTHFKSMQSHGGPEQKQRLSAADEFITLYQIPHFPIYLGLSRSFPNVLASWSAERRNIALAGLTLTVSIIIFLAFSFGRIRKDQQREMMIRRFFFAVEQSSASIMITDTNGCIEYVNPWFSTLTGYERNEVYGLKPSILKSGYTPDEEYAQLWKDITTGKPWRGEFLNRKKNGHLFWELARISPIRDLNGNISNYLAVKEDITEQKKYEQEMALQRQRLSEIIWSTNIGTWEWNVQTGEIILNDRWAEIIGYTLNELAPINIQTMLRYVHPDDQAAYSTLLKNYFSDDTDHYEYEYRVRHKNGEWVWVHNRGKVVEWSDDDKPLRMSGTLSEITKRKQNEHELYLAKEAAEKANLAKSQFLSSMSHELRTPLNAILGFAQVLELNPQEPLSEKQTNAVNQILKGGKHLLDLINDVLNLAQIESGHMNISIEPVETRQVIEECISAAKALTHKLDVSIEADGFIGATILADRTRFKQVLLNLLSNAIKYNRTGGKVILSSTITDDKMQRIAIADTGLGIPQKLQTELFKPFSRLGAENSNIEGTGIGLTITQRLLRAMGGRLEFESTEGFGSTFWISFPLAINHQINPSQASQAGKKQPVTDSKKGLILYIEDNPDNIALMEYIVANLTGIGLKTAHTAELGIAIAIRDKPDLILMDINLPGMNGYEALAELRRHEKTLEIPVFAISADAMPGEVQRGKEAGFLAYLTKPINVADLTATITDVFSRRPQ